MASAPAPTPGHARGQYGGGFIEALLTGGGASQSQVAAANASGHASDAEAEPDPQFRRQDVEYSGPEAPGTIVVDTPEQVPVSRRAERKGAALRDRRRASRLRMVRRQADQPQVRMAGLDTAGADAAAPPRPAPPHGGRARQSARRRALYLGSSLYRIHGTNEPSTIGHNVSSGCIRMMNEDVMDLYERVSVGTKVIVL